MKPKPNDLIVCYNTQEKRPYKEFKRMLGGSGNHRKELEFWWNRMRPDGTYNNYILQDENGDDTFPTHIRRQVLGFVDMMTEEQLKYWLKIEDHELKEKQQRDSNKS